MQTKGFSVACIASALLLSSCGGARQPETAARGVAVKQMPTGKEYSGLLSDYSKLKPNAEFENTMSYVSTDPAKNIHKYIAVIVEPVAVYVATNVDPKNIPDNGRAALVDYFQVSITHAVQDAFPVDPGNGSPGSPRLVLPSSWRRPSAWINATL